MAPTVPVYTAPVDRYLTDFWGLFQVLPVSDGGGAFASNALTATVNQRVATLQARSVGHPTPGNDRRLYLLDESFEATDVEAHLTYFTPGGGQSGVAVRVQPGGTGHVAPIIWHNVFFGTSGTQLVGAWDFPGTTGSFGLNQQTSPLPFFGYPRTILSATGDGTTATVTLGERHLIDLVPNSSGVTIRNNTLFPGNPFVGATVVDPFTFTVPHATVGTQPGGQVEWPFWPGVHRTLAVRLVGTTITAKQWPVDYVPEPSWSDTVKTGSVVMPDPLAGGVPFPSGPGRTGFLVAHLGVTGRFEVRKFEAVRLA